MSEQEPREKRDSGIILSVFFLYFEFYQYSEGVVGVFLMRGF